MFPPSLSGVPGQVIQPGPCVVEEKAFSLSDRQRVSLFSVSLRIFVDSSTNQAEANRLVSGVFDGSTSLDKLNV